MKLTNRHNLPDAFVQAVKNDEYSRGDADLSVTQAIDAPQVVELTRQHFDEIVEDVEDRVWSLFGQATHAILERANKTAVAERRLSVEIEGWKVSGGMDLYDMDGVLTDYKTTSVWSIIYDGASKWEKQLNCYAVLLRRHGHKVERLQAVVILRDWSRSKLEESQRKGWAYPESMVVNVPLPVWAPEIAEKYLRERVILHKQARLSGQITGCTDDDKWVRGTTWAVKKPGAKTAMKGGSGFKTEDEARAFAGFDKTLVIEHRPGGPNRCINYCNVAQWCPQFKSYVAQSARPADETTPEKQAV